MNDLTPITQEPWFLAMQPKQMTAPEAHQWIADHSNAADLDEGELKAAFTALFGPPDLIDYKVGLWSRLWTASQRIKMNVGINLPEAKPPQAAALLRIAEIDRLIECHKMLYERHKKEVVRLEMEKAALQR